MSSRDIVFAELQSAGRPWKDVAVNSDNVNFSPAAT